MNNKIIKDYSVSKKDFELIYNDEFNMYKTNFTNFDSLDNYYQSENYISHTDGKRNWFEKTYQLVKNTTIRNKWKLIRKLKTEKQDLKVLDIGCGTGDFLKYGIENFKVDAVGVEPNANARQIALSKNIFVCDTLANLKDEVFDVITLWHVLEHVTDLKEYFNFFNSFLKTDGVVIIAVPNFNSYDAKHYKNFWAAWDVPRHLWHFSKTSIEKLALRNSFKVIHIKPMYFDSFYVSLLSEEYKTGSKNIFKAVSIGLLSNLSGLTTKEYSSHIYILKKQRK